MKKGWGEVTRVIADCTFPDCLEGSGPVLPGTQVQCKKPRRFRQGFRGK